VSPATKEESVEKSSSRGHNSMAFSTYSQREVRWARERAAVSKEIEEASPSRVIVVDDSPEHSEHDSELDDDGESEFEDTVANENEDIWLHAGSAATPAKPTKVASSDEQKRAESEATQSQPQ